MALPSKYGIDKNMNSMEGLSAYENGGKGSGNFGHAGRPGERGGSSRSASTTARLARGDKVADAEREARELESELIKAPYSSMTESEYQSKRAKVDEASRKARELAEENKRLSKEEIKRGMDKKRNQDTPGKKETLKALEEAQKAAEATRKAYGRKTEAKYGSEEYKKAEEEADKAVQKSREAGKKLESVITSQMTKDKQFNDDLKQHIEDGLGVKLGDLKLTVKDYGANGREWKSVEGTAKLDNKDLGAFGKVLRGAKVEVDTRMNTDSTSDNFGTMWGSADLRYESRSGGGNGQNLFRINYYPDGTYIISDDRGGF